MGERYFLCLFRCTISDIPYSDLPDFEPRFSPLHLADMKLHIAIQLQKVEH